MYSPTTQSVNNNVARCFSCVTQIARVRKAVFAFILDKQLACVALGMETLSVFALKTSKHPVQNSWFVLNEKQQVMRPAQLKCKDWKIVQFCNSLYKKVVKRSDLETMHGACGS